MRKEQDASPIGPCPEKYLCIVVYAFQELRLASLALGNLLGEQQERGGGLCAGSLFVPPDPIHMREYVTPGRVLYEPHVAEHVRVSKLFRQIAQHLAREFVGPEEPPVGVHVRRRHRARQAIANLVKLCEELLWEEVMQVSDAL